MAAAHQREVLVAEGGECGEATAEAGGEKEFGRVATQIAARRQSVENADEQAADNIDRQSGVGEYSRHVVLNEFGSQEAQGRTHAAAQRHDD